MTAAAALRVTQLVVRYGSVAALRGVDLSVAQGGCTAVLGPSGCGKSTLLRAIAGLVRAQAGRIEIGDTVTDSPGPIVRPENRRAALVFQDLALWPHMTVSGNVEFVLEARGVPRGERQAAVARVAATVGLPEALLGRRPGELSGGERQRAALARALAQEPRVLLLDEPLTGLDRHLRHRLLETLGALRRETGLAMLVVTHDREEAFALADRVAVIRAGEVVQEGTPEDVYARPGSGFVADFVGAASLLPATPADGALRTALGVFAADGEIAVACTAVFRPEAVHVVPDGGVAGRVAASFYRGDHVLLAVTVGEGERVLVRSGTRIAAGSEVRLRADRPAFVRAPAAAFGNDKESV